MKKRARPGEAKNYFETVVLLYEEDDCLIWPYATDKDGYALFGDNGKISLASRIICKRIYGPAPTINHQAAHSCGKGHLGCVNKKHLRWTTQQEK